MRQRWSLIIGKSVLMVGVLGAVMVFVVTAAADMVLLQERPNGNVGTVVEETDEYIVIKFPRSEIKLIRRDAHAADTKASLSPSPEPGRAQLFLPQSLDSQTRTDLKAELKTELREELKEEITRGTMGNFSGPAEFGRVEGFILFRGEGLPEYQVKLVRLTEAASLLGVFKEFQEGAEFETTTDKEGGYVFEQVPVGSYKLKWQPKGGRSWIRRLSDRPDVIVREGQTAAPKDIDTDKPLLPQ